MYDFKKLTMMPVPWETTRDKVSISSSQINQDSGYDWYRKDPVCNGACWVESIFEQLVACYYGEGDYSRTG